MRLIITVAVLVVFSSEVVFAADGLMDVAKKATDKAVELSKPKAEPKPETPQQQADELQLKVNALNSLSSMLSHERTNANARVKMMQGYLEFLGKMDDYEKSDLANNKPKQIMTFDHAVAAAIEHEKTKPAVNVADVDDAEIAMLKRVESATETLCKKMWDEVVDAHQQASCIAGYLKSIDKLNGYEKWAGVEVEKQKLAADAKQKERRAASEAAEKEKLKQQQERQQKRYAEIHQEHLTNMQRQFELKRQKMAEDAQYRLAPRERNNYWHGWGDQYNDVYQQPY